MTKHFKVLTLSDEEIARSKSLTEELRRRAVQLLTKSAYVGLTEAEIKEIREILSIGD